MSKCKTEAECQWMPWCRINGKCKGSAAQITHAEGCWAWGPKHYKCALRLIADLTERSDKVPPPPSSSDPC